MEAKNLYNLKSLSNIYSWALAIAFVFPFYFGITHKGVLFPIESITFEGAGIPVPLSMPIVLISAAIIILFKRSHLNINWLFVAYALFLMFLNWLRVGQALLVFIYFFFLYNLPANFFFLVFRRTIISAIILYEIHLISFGQSVVVQGSNFHHGFESIYGAWIYSPFISYVSGVILVLIGSCLLETRIKFCASLVGLPLLVFSHRTMALFFVPIVLIISRWRWILLILAAMFFFYPESSVIIDRTLGKLNGADGGLASGRPLAWLEFIRAINSYKDVFLGVHRFDLRPHNYWLQLINVGGVPLLGVTIYFFARVLFKAWVAMKNARLYFFIFLIWFLLDTNINSPFTQPYVIGLAMLVIVAMIKRDEYVQV